MIQEKGKLPDTPLINTLDLVDEYITLTIPPPFQKNISSTQRTHLNSSYRFTFNRWSYNQEFTSNDLQRLREISRGLKPTTFNRSYLPIFDIVLRILSLQHKPEYREGQFTFSQLYDLFKSMQWLIISYYTFHPGIDRNLGTYPSHVVHWVFKAINEAIFLNPPSIDCRKRYVSLSSQLSTPHIWKLNLQKSRSVTKTYCTLLLSSLSKIINARATFHNIDKLDAREVRSLLKEVTDLFLLFESICHIAGCCIGTTNSTAKTTGTLPAFMELFERRRKNLPKTFTKCIALDLEIPATLKILKTIIGSFLDILPTIDWSQLRQIVSRKALASTYVTEVKNAQIHILAALLVVDDLDLIAHFKLVQRCKFI